MATNLPPHPLGHPAPPGLGRDHLPPLRALLIVAGSVFLTELVIMLVLTRVVDIPPWLSLLDAVVQTALVFPLLQRFLLAPLKAQIAQRQQAEAGLRLQTAALQATTHSVVITDLDGAVRWANPAFLAMTGYTEAEVIGQPLSLLESGAPPAADDAARWQTVRAGQVWQGERLHRRKDGSLYSEEQTITPVRDETGAIAHFVAVKIDCTERQRTATELAQRNAELVEMSQAERRQRQLAEALEQATQALNASLVLEEVLDRILEQIQRVVPCRMVAVMLLRGDRIDLVRYRDVTGATYVEPSNLSLDQFSQLPAILAARAPRSIADMTAEPGWSALPGMEWIRSAVLVPLVEQAHVPGFLAVLDARVGFFDDAICAFLNAFAPHAVAALQNASLYQAEGYARRKAETLSAASLALTRSLNLPEVLDSLLHYLSQLAPYDGALIALLEGDTRLALKATACTCAHPPSPDQTPPVDLWPYPELQTLIRTQQSEVLDHPALNPGWVCSRHPTPMQSWLGVPIVAGDRALGLCLLEHQAAGFYTAEHRRLAEVLVAQAAMTIHNAQLFAQVKAGHERLQSLSHRLVQVQESERRFVASELHDEAGQVLTSLKLGLRDLERHVQDPEAVQAGIARLRSLADTVLQSLHRLAMDLHPVSLDHLGLVAALAGQVRDLEGRAGPMGEGEGRAALQVGFRAVGVGPDQARLPPDLEIALYRIVQEALTNVLRHAQATRADVILHRHAGKVTLVVEDNGIGFAPEALPSGHLGLVGMRERCEMCNGTLVVESAPGRGTTLVAEIPL